MVRIGASQEPTELGLDLLRLRLTTEKAVNPLEAKLDPEPRLQSSGIREEPCLGGVLEYVEGLLEPFLRHPRVGEPGARVG